VLRAAADLLTKTFIVTPELPLATGCRGRAATRDRHPADGPYRDDHAVIAGIVCLSRAATPELRRSTHSLRSRELERVPICVS